MDQIEGKKLDCCEKLISDIKTRKNSMTKIIRSIPLEYSKIIYSPDSLRMQIIGLKWESDHQNKTYIELRESKTEILNYLNIVDADMFERKLNDIIKYMD